MDCMSTEQSHMDITEEDSTVKRILYKYKLKDIHLGININVFVISWFSTYIQL